MWCKVCQQDVPAIASPDEDVVRCAKCRHALTRPEQKPEAPPTSSPAPAPPYPAVGETFWTGRSRSDLWELERELQATRRLLESCSVDRSEKKLRLDEAHAFTSNLDSTATAAGQPGDSAEETEGDLAVTAWAVFLLGALALSCGLILLAVWAVSDRAEYWRLGLPVVCGGQTALLVAIALHACVLIRRYRQAQAQLAQLGVELSDLRRQVTLLSPAPRVGSSLDRYRWDSPNSRQQLMNLQSQLERLASRLAAREPALDTR